MKEILYDQNTVVIASFLLGSMALAINIGRRVGLKFQDVSSEHFNSHVNGIQGSLLGILALLLGFAFSLSLQRFESRSEAVVDEANAIGTTWLRAKLLPAPLHDEANTLLLAYVDSRVEAGRIAMSDDTERERQLQQSARVLDALWAVAARAAAEDGNPVRTGLFIQSLNESIDAFGSRDAQLRRHVPEMVLFLLFGTFVLTGGVVGYATGVAGHETSAATYILVLLVVVLAFIIVDLDHPRRGTIVVDQSSMLSLQAAMHEGRLAVF